MSMRLPSVLIVPALGLAMAGAGACSVTVDTAGYVQRDEKHFPAEGVMDLELATFDGSMEIRSWDQPEILVDIEKRGQDEAAVSRIEVTVTQDGSHIRVEAKHAHTSGIFIGRFTSPSARFTVSVPRKTNLLVKTGDGSIVAEHVEGKIELSSGDGSIKANGTAGALTVHSGDGSIQVDDVQGTVDASTGDGSLRMAGAPSVVRARSGDGSVVLRIRSGAKMAGDWSITTGDGSISVELPGDFDADIEADPSGGRARSDLQLTNQTGGTRDERVLRGRLGAGGYRLRLRTGDGSIRLTGA